MSDACQHCYCQYQARNGVRHERCCRCGNVIGRGMSYGGPSWKNKPWKINATERFRTRSFWCRMGIHQPIERLTEVIPDWPHLGTFRCGQCSYTWRIETDGIQPMPLDLDIPDGPPSGE